MNRNEKTGMIYVAIAGICWGIIGIFTRRLGTAGLDSIQITFLRNFFAAAELFLFLFIKDKRNLRINIKDIWMFVGTGICSVAFFNICYFRTIEMTTMSIAAILLYTAPCMVMIMSCIFFKESITWQKVAALLLAFTGCLFTTGVLQSESRISGIGILIGLGSGFGYALYSIFGTVATRKYNSFTITFYTFLLASIGIGPFAHAGSLVSSISHNMEIIVISVLLATVSTVIPFICYTKGLKKMEAGKASIMAFIEPMIATICGILVFGEKFTLGNLTGVVLILASIIFLNTKMKIKGRAKHG